MVKNVLRSFPTIQEADLRALPLDRLKMITDFVSGIVQDDAAEAAPAEVKNSTGESN
jgi:hypothetical protein